MRICKKCSTKLKQEDKFCPTCGKETNRMEFKQPNTTTRKFKWQYAALAILAIVIGMAIGAIFNSKKAPDIKVTSGEASKQSTTATEVKNERTSWLKTKGKEKVDTLKLKEDAIQVFSTSNYGHDYDIYLLQEGVVEEEETEGEYANYGDILEMSQLVFYVSEKDGKFGYRQQQLEPLTFTRNLSLQSSTANDWYEEIQFENYHLIALYEYFDIFSYRQLHLFDFVDGELKKISTDEMTYSYYYPVVKALENDKLQVVLLEESDEFQWIYETYEYNREYATLQLYNEQTYDLEDLLENQLGSIIFEHWEEHDDAYVPYTKDSEQKIWNLDEVLDKVDSGKFGDLPVKVGDTMIDVYNKNKSISYISPSRSYGVSLEVTFDGYQVGYAPILKDIGYFEGELEIDFRGPVRYIRIPEKYTTFTMDEVIEKLGTPDDQFEAEENFIEESYYSYQLGEYNLIFSEKLYENDVSITITDDEDLISYIAY